VQELEDENNPSNLFFDEHVEEEMGSYIEKGELFEKYSAWATKTKNYTLSSARFSTAVFKKFHKNTPKTTSHPETHKRIWRNIKYVHFKTTQVKNEINWQDSEPATISNISDAKVVDAVKSGTGSQDIMWGEL
jgi:hypothetical protein